MRFSRDDYYRSAFTHEQVISLAYGDGTVKTISNSMSVDMSTNEKDLDIIKEHFKCEWRNNPLVKAAYQFILTLIPTGCDWCTLATASTAFMHIATSNSLVHFFRKCLETEYVLDVEDDLPDCDKHCDNKVLNAAIIDQMYHYSYETVTNGFLCKGYISDIFQYILGQIDYNIAHNQRNVCDVIYKNKRQFLVAGNTCFMHKLHEGEWDVEKCYNCPMSDVYLDDEVCMELCNKTMCHTIHKHSSKLQFLLEFSQLYCHPNQYNKRMLGYSEVDKIIRRLCSCNPEYDYAEVVSTLSKHKLNLDLHERSNM